MLTGRSGLDSSRGPGWLILLPYMRSMSLANVRFDMADVKFLAITRSGSLPRIDQSAFPVTWRMC